MACNVTPESRLLETRHYDVTGGDCHLTVEYFAETSDKIYVVIWNSLPDFLRNSEIICIFVAGYRSPISDTNASRGG